MSFPPDFLDDLRARVSIADVVGRRVSFDPRKSNPRKRDYWACCPFHGEKTPSFHVDDAKGFYHCFGCQASGDAIKFLQTLDNLSFAEAVARLAEEVGLDVPAQDPHAALKRDAQKSLQAVLALAETFFQASLLGPAGRAARAYLEKRGCGPAQWQAFGLGYAPPGRHSLRAHLGKEGVPVERMIEAGLTGMGDGEPYDRFRDRVMFPIRDARNRLVGFGGRLIGEDSKAPKYLNSPETALFKKGAVLFHLPEARLAARAAGTLVVAEGYMDVIALARAGIDHAVAPLGTALTEEQLALLWQVCREPILCLDGDEAGQRAARRAAELALPHLKPGYSLRFVLLPAGRDPDDVVRGQGADAMKALLAAPIPLIDMLWEWELNAGPRDTPERRAELEERLRRLVRLIEDRAVRGHYGRDLAARLAGLFAPARPAQAHGARRAPGVQGVSPGLRRSALAGQRSAAVPLAAGAFQDLECLLVGALLDQPALLDRLGETLTEHPFTLPALDRLSNELIDLSARGGSLDSTSLRGHLKERGVFDAAEPLLLRDVVKRRRASWVTLGVDETEREWRRLAGRLRRARQLRTDIEDAKTALSQGEDETTVRRLKALVAEWQALEAEVLVPDTGLGLH